MRKYEIMFIVKPTLSEEDVKKVFQSFQDTLTSNGAKVIEKQELGQRELAYEIKKFKSGYYFLFEIESMDDKAVSEFNRLALISSDVIRHLVKRIEK
jgi:small subunit ribosomal protein S6